MSDTQLLSADQITNGLAGNFRGQPYITYIAFDAPYARYYWNGSALVLFGSGGGGGSGDVTKVGTPVNNQVGVWTGNGTIEGDAALSFDTTNDTLAIGASGTLAFGAVAVLVDAAGTTTLQNIDALDATTEATIEGAIDTLVNLTSVQGRTIALADAGFDALFGWDDSASQYVNLSAADARAAAGAAPLTPNVIPDSDGTRILSSADNGAYVDMTNVSGNAVSITTAFNGFGTVIQYPADAAPPVLTPTGVTLDGLSAAITAAAGGGALVITPIGTNAFRVLGSKRTTIELTEVKLTDYGTEIGVAGATQVFRTKIKSAHTLTALSAWVGAAPAGGTISINVKNNGTTIFSAPLVIAAGQQDSTGGTISNGAFAVGDILTVEITVTGTDAVDLELHRFGYVR